MRALLAGLAGLAVASAALGGPSQPAELPPADFASQQYVDSKGCLFVRAGTGDKVLWIPRVSRDGVPVCGNPPSGKRVPVAEETGVQPVPEAGDETTVASAPAAQPTMDSVAAEPATGSYFVAVGSFGVAENADRAEAKLTEMHFGVIRGRVQGGSGTLITVFAGPFATSADAEAARATLRDSGFPDATVMRP